MQPFIETPQYLRNNGTVKLFWIANVTEGVSYNYTVIIHNVTIISSSVVVVNETVFIPYFLFEQCGEFDAQVKVVNGAGESKLSETVRFSLPLLPEIQPLSDSLSHRVWKSNGDMMVLIIFEVSLYIVDF